MPDIPITPLTRWRAAVAEAVARAAGGPQERVADTMTLERPKRAEFGDYSTNAALLLAPGAGRNPRELAQEIGDELAGLLGEQLGSVDVAGPGFVNLSLADGWLRAALAGVLEAGGRFGAGAADPVELVNVEFISANPTGPMHVGHARNAAYGDALARMLEFQGHRVEREFYVNDAGTQIARFGASLKAAASGQPVPEDGYHGDYIAGLAGRIPGAAQMDETELGRAAVALMITAFEQTLADFAVLPFDHWSYESALHDGSPSPVDDALELLAQQGRTYERTARSGCGPQSSATTRTASSCARAASTPTSPRTSPTTRPSASAASSARSTSGAPTTTATSAGCAPPIAALGGDPDETRDADHAARAPRQLRRAGPDVQARGRVRDRSRSWSR